MKLVKPIQLIHTYSTNYDDSQYKTDILFEGFDTKSLDLHSIVIFMGGRPLEKSTFTLIRIWDRELFHDYFKVLDPYGGFDVHKLKDELEKFVKDYFIKIGVEEEN